MKIKTLTIFILILILSAFASCIGDIEFDLFWGDEEEEYVFEYEWDNESYWSSYEQWVFWQENEYDAWQTEHDCEETIPEPAITGLIIIGGITTLIIKRKFL